MMLLCRAYCSCDFSGPDFMLVDLTGEFLDGLQTRQRLAQRLKTDDPEPFQFDSLVFIDFSPVWFSWCEQHEHVLNKVSSGEGIHFGDRRLDVPESEDGVDIVSRTEVDRMQVWPAAFRFSCLLNNTDIPVQSEMIRFDEILRNAELHRTEGDIANDNPG